MNHLKTNLNKRLWISHLWEISVVSLAEQVSQEAPGNENAGVSSPTINAGAKEQASKVKG